jgi:murein DD-endopeptidase MepM/ murein hydrolase activator NlpD
VPRSQRFLLSTIVVIIAALAPAAPVVATDPSTKFIWPTSGRITQGFGCTGFWAEPRFGSCRHFHGGIDIANSRGTLVRAAADGIIAHVGWDQWGTHNWMVIINHGGGLTTWYAHLRGREMAGIRKGARVSQGEVVGYMDATGMATGVHLHWAVLKNGHYVNPGNYVDGSPVRRRPSTGSPASSCTTVFVAIEPGAVIAAALDRDGGSNGMSCATA